MGVLLLREELERIGDRLRAQGKRIVTTNGCFDLLHVGHVRILKAARQMGDVLVVGINSDESVAKLKGPNRPVMPERERAEILCNLTSVDYVTIFNEDTPVQFLKGIKPLFHVKGSDYKAEELSETPVVESFGGEVKILDLVPEHSTTDILKKIKTTVKAK